MLQIAEPNTKPKTRRVSIAVNESVMSSLERMAEEIGLDRSQLIRRILKKEIKKEIELEQTASKENVVAFPTCQSCHHSPECEWFAPTNGN